MQIPESEKPHGELIDLLTDACKTSYDIEDEDGKIHKENLLNPKKVWCKTQLVNSETFGRLIFEKEILQNKAIDCFNYMSYERASVISQQILSIIDALDYSIDAKSSETRRDKHNSQSSLVQILTRNLSEKKYTVQEEMKKGIWESITGKEKDENSG